MRIFWVFRAKTVIYCLAAGFVLLLVAYSLSFAAGEVFSRKAKYVIFLGQELDPAATDIREQVARLTQSLTQDPSPAQHDTVNKSVIPEINGFEIDVEASVVAVKKAGKGAVVSPIWREIEPERKIGDFPLLPIYQGNPQKNMVALVVNVSWGNEYLEEMLDILAAEQVPASFFLVGRWAEQNPELVQRIWELEMDFGNHGYSDPHMQDLSPEAIQEEIIKTNQIVEGLTGIKLRWFSPPYGEKVEKIYTAAAESGLRTVLWTLDTIDWTLPGEEEIVKRIVEHLHNGAIILMHPTEQTPGALKAIIAGIRAKNLDFATVTELLNPSYWPQKYSLLWSEN